MNRFHVAVLAAAAVALAGCSDELSPIAPAPLPEFGVSPDVRVDMSNFVAIGTSVSMGWMSDGVVHTSQERAWVSQLAADVGVPFTLPGIAAPGCRPPLAAPLIGFRRVDSSPATASTTCAANLPGVSLPTHNLAVEGATAMDALYSTPETATNGRGPVTSRVLPSGMTQVTAMRSLAPTFVSVEFGGNEILSAQVGLLIPGVTYVPFSAFASSYSAIIDQVRATGAKAILVTLPTDLSRFPTIRTGPEIASQRVAFAAYNVSVNADCDASPNFIFVRGKVLTAVATGVQRARLGFGPYDLSCADVPGTMDFVLTPADIAALNALATQMSDFIRDRAAENGYASFSMSVLYDSSKEDVPFDLESFLRSDAPYGPKISLDGVHASPAGHRVLARAARVAIQQTYGSP